MKAYPLEIKQADYGVGFYSKGHHNKTVFFETVLRLFQVLALSEQNVIHGYWRSANERFPITAIWFTVGEI